MRMPDATFQVMKRFATQFPPPEGQPGPAHEENCRKWTRTLAEQCAFSFPNDGYGCKRAGPGRPLSKDCLAQRDGSVLRGYDVMTGAGTGHPRLASSPPESVDLVGQIFEPVTPVDRLNVEGPSGQGEGSGGGEGQPAGSAVDLGPILTLLGTIHEEVSALRDEVAEVKSAIAASLSAAGPPSGAAPGDAALKAALEQAGWPLEISAGVLGTLSGFVGRKP